jgi:hypothetical protein
MDECRPGLRTAKPWSKIIQISILGFVGLIALIEAARLSIIGNVPFPASFIIEVLVFEGRTATELALNEFHFE